jgi:hypothetical protein
MPTQRVATGRHNCADTVRPEVLVLPNRARPKNRFGIGESRSLVFDYGQFSFESKGEVLEKSREWWNPGKTEALALERLPVGAPAAPGSRIFSTPCL